MPKLKKYRYTVYILRCKDNSLYTGITTDIERRFEEHQAGTASKYTRVRIPVALVYTEKAVDRSSATKREMEIKKMSRTQKEILIGEKC